MESADHYWNAVGTKLPGDINGARKLIGLNTDQTDERPWEYVLVRHVPISPESFEFYGDDLLSNFDARPTWLEATPHNIQRVTPQAEACENCHLVYRDGRGGEGAPELHRAVPVRSSRQAQGRC